MLYCLLMYAAVMDSSCRAIATLARAGPPAPSPVKSRDHLQDMIRSMTRIIVSNQS